MKQRTLVPDTFQLAGTVWTVKREANLDGAIGECHRDKAVILLRTGLSQQIEESTFCHELIHAIKYTMGHTGDKHDEVEVDAMGGLLHQFLNSAALSPKPDSKRKRVR